MKNDNGNWNESAWFPYNETTYDMQTQHATINPASPPGERLVENDPPIPWDPPETDPNWIGVRCC